MSAATFPNPHQSSYRQQQLQDYRSTLRSQLSNRRQQRKVNAEGSTGKLAHPQLQPLLLQAFGSTLSAITLALAAAQFGYAQYQPIVFTLGWLFFCSLQVSVNKVIFICKMRKGSPAEEAQGLGLGMHPAFRVCLMLAMLSAFSFSVVYHRGFFFTAGIVCAWMLQCYYRQIRQLQGWQNLLTSLQAIITR